MKNRHTEHIVRYHPHTLPVDKKTDWKRVDAMTQKEREENAKSDPDSILADEHFWKLAKLVMPSVEKEKISLRVDADVLDWFRKQGKGYQARINTILRTFMRAVDDENSHPKTR